MTSGDFRYRWVGDELHAVNEAVGRSYVLGGCCHAVPLMARQRPKFWVLMFCLVKDGCHIDCWKKGLR